MRRGRSARVSLCPCTTAIPAKTAEPIEMPYEMGTYGAQETMHCRWWAHVPQGKGHFGAIGVILEHAHACQRTVDVLSVNRKGQQRCGRSLPLT